MRAGEAVSRDLALSTVLDQGRTLHIGMKLSESDWSALLRHLNATLEAFQVPQAERDDVVAFVQSTKLNIVEA